MKKRILYKILILIFVMFFMINAFTNVSFATQPRDITGSDISVDGLDIIDNITELIRTVGSFIAVGALMIIGIRYMMGSADERASYKRSMMPYIIGCFILFGASNIAPQFKEVFSNLGDTKEDIGGNILGLIQTIGSFISVGILMVIGIKYMMGSTEERASYKKSMIPYIVGAILLFGALNITTAIYNAVPKENSTATQSQDTSQIG